MIFSKKLLILYVVTSMIFVMCNDATVVAPVQQESQSNTSNRIAYMFDGEEGDAISPDSAQRWISNYLNKNGLVESHYFSKASVEKILNTNECIGIRIYYAIDQSGATGLIAVGADNHGNDLPGTFRCKAKVARAEFLSRSVNEKYSGIERDSVSAKMAKAQTSSYQYVAPREIQAHFFGRKILEQIFAESECVGIRCYFATNSLGIRQLILVGIRGNGVNIIPFPNGNSRVKDADAIVVDVSFPCPTHCSGT